MSKITISAELAALLRAATAEAELVGPDGQHVGLFVPAGDEDRVTLDELKAADADGGECTMEDVFKLLEKYK